MDWPLWLNSSVFFRKRTSARVIRSQKFVKKPKHIRENVIHSKKYPALHQKAI